MVNKVIVADDDKDFRETQIAVLRRFCRNKEIDAEFDEASDGEELVNKVLQSQYDLIFTDNEMPKINGLRAIKELREKGQAIPIYMISGSDVSEVALGLGATGYIPKNNFE